MATTEELTARIEAALERGDYRPGDWQRLTRQVRRMSRSERRTLASEMSDLGNRLHRRHGFLELPFPLALALEIGLAACGFVALSVGAHPVVAVIGLGALLASLQPLIKVAAGLLLGVRYAYAYLWYVEPRFKMQYGSYLALSAVARVGLNLAGSIGTPLAFLLAALLLAPSLDGFAKLCWLGFWLLAGVQVASFLAPLFGLRRVGRIPVALLTSPATAAVELKEMLGD